MKRILSGSLLLASFSLQAGELKFGDLNYFLEKGQFNLAADGIYRSEKMRVGGVTQKTDGYYSQPKLAYAIQDNLNAFVGIDYQHHVKTSIAGANKFSSDGAGNPLVGLNYRAMSQNAGKYNLDFGAVTSFKISDAERGTTEKHGNAVHPRNILELNARLGKKFNEANEVYFSVAGVYNQSGEYDQLGATTDTVELDSSCDVKFGALYQYRPVNEFMLTIGVLGTRYGEAEGKNETEKFTTDAHMDFEVPFTAKYLITDHFIAKFHYIQGNRPDYDVDYDLSGKSTVDRRHYHAIGFGADVLF